MGIAQSTYEAGVKKLKEHRKQQMDQFQTALRVHLEALMVDASPYHNEDEDKNCTSCTHLFLHKWDGIYVCTDCMYCLNDTVENTELNKDRLRIEEAAERSTPRDQIPASLCQEDIKIFKGKSSAKRGVKLGFIYAITVYLDCWEWSSAEFIRRVIKPNTQDGRIRFVELDWMKDYIGQADSFLSYAQAGKWGDVIAALLDGNADLNRIIWMDIFAVRQWPSNDPDLDFASTIENCDSFVVVISHLEEINSNTKWYDKRHTVISPMVRKQISFMRVWCLVEAAKAASMPHIKYIVKCGKHKMTKTEESREDTEEKVTRVSIDFIESARMLENLHHIVDVESADATVPSDKEKIIDDIRNGIGIDKLNSVIVGSLQGALAGKSFIGGSSSMVQCAACGDEDLMDLITEDKQSILMAAANGFTDLLEKLLVRSNHLIYERGKYGFSLLHFASAGGHDDCVQLLLKYESLDINIGNVGGDPPLMYASKLGHVSTVHILLQNEAIDVNKKNCNGKTALMLAYANDHPKVVAAILDTNKVRILQTY